MHVADVIQEGESNLWWHQSNLGVPLFAAYQPLPTMAMGCLIAFLGDILLPISMFKLSILLVWACMPVAWYRGARWYGLSVHFSVVLGLLTLLIHDPYGIGFGIRSATHRGLYTQHFGLLFLPLFVGAFRRLLISKDIRPLFVALIFSLTTMSHLWVGLYAVIVAVLLALLHPKRLIDRYKEMGVFVLTVVVLISWWMVPLLQTNHYAGGLPWLHQMHNGWPLIKTFSMFFGGDIFDFSRSPVLTFFVVVGAALLIVQHKNKAVQHWFALSAITMVFFLGRTNWGELYNLLPLHRQVNVMRYLTGVHICGLVAATYSLICLRTILIGWFPVRGFVLFGVVLSCLVLYSTADIHKTLRLFYDRQPNFLSLVSHLKTRPDNRIAVHGSLGTGSHFHRDMLPWLAQRGQLQSYAHGYHTTLSTYYAEYFDFSPVACDLYDVGSIVARNPVPKSFPTDAYEEIWKNEIYSVFHSQQSTPSRMFSVVYTQGAIIGPSFRDLRPAVRHLSVPAYAKGFLPRVIVDEELSHVVVENGNGARTEWSTGRATDIIDGFNKNLPIPGHVTLENYERGLASYSIDVVINDTEKKKPAKVQPMLLIKTNMFPWWHAYVDEKEAPIVHVAPNFMAIPLPSTSANVRFAFVNPWWQKLGALVCLLLMVGIILDKLVRTRSMLSGNIEEQEF